MFPARQFALWLTNGKTQLQAKDDLVEAVYRQTLGGERQRRLAPEQSLAGRGGKF